MDLDIDQGEFVSIVGPSGCGKSTLLELVAGLQVPSSGSVRVADEPLRAPREHTAIIFQDSATLPWRTVLDNVAFPLEVQGVRRAERRERAEALLDKVGLAGFASHHPGQLSGGMRQRVAIARALIMEPDLILADEPFGALDEQTRLLMAFELLAVVERLETAVLFITHSIQEAVLLSDRILVMGARPGTFLDEIRIDLPRPRAEDTLTTPTAIGATERIWGTLRDQASTSMRSTS
ncbi:ABC transporter ATP-binding protein [Nocardiopsis aegyptia]|uniref:NitT/TauT family transport system ATP-binding protein n=1 Tax=Nocardiopsis aegyptia TaxID=220378 RepID=A0A7Z0ENV9_9ACTN|nr:ABC transporter ATP-binding protein [Nocardiopsis aegyptia]NYJ35016.1 NitT/TauT family transport system ATP-binding protein [Nocardiopsis aegyptia]